MVQKLSAVAAVGVVLLLALLVTPTITPDQDASVYLAAAHGYRTEGLANQYPREPFYPFFLAVLEWMGLPLVRALPLVQNALFMAGLFFFLDSMYGSRRRSAELWRAAALLTLIPTFLVTSNGAMYTESLSCTLIFLLLGSLLRIFGGGAGEHRSRGAVAFRCVAWAVVAMLASVSLALIKGTFLYANVAFGLVGAVAAAFLPATRARRATLAATFLGVAVFAWSGTTIWLASRTPRLATFERGGVIFFSRTEFAARFDLKRQTLPFLVNALSEGACRRIYAGRCASFALDAETELGFTERARSHGDERALFAKGFRNIRQQPLRQLVFAGFELARFILHHGTTGFAVLDAPILGPLLRSPVTTFLLKLFNVLLYLVVPATWFALRRRGRRWRDVWQAWPEAMKFGTGYYLVYSCLYLAVYSFATTALRMVYPVAPFLIVFDAQVIGTARSLLRPKLAR